MEDTGPKDILTELGCLVEIICVLGVGVGYNVPVGLDALPEMAAGRKVRGNIGNLVHQGNQGQSQGRRIKF